MIKTICIVCKKSFYTYPCRIKIGIGKFCSRKCYSSIRDKEIILRGSKTRYKKEHVPFSKIHPEKLPHGKNHWEWKGENVGYRGLHYWIRRQKGEPKICNICGKKAEDWANVDGKYKRNLNDYISLCKSCHKNYDLSHKLTHQRC